MKLYSHEEVLDKVLGPKGNIDRDEHDANVQSFLMGEALKKARLSKNLTQEELGKIIGVKRAQISRIEKGYNLTLGTVSKVLKLYKKFKLAEEGEEENMSKAKFEIEGREAWADVIAQVQEHEGKDAYYVDY